MKQSFHASALILLFIILVSSPKISARFFATKQGQDDKVKLNEIKTGGYQVEPQSGGESIDLMGSEKCDNGDEECIQRRVISEAHLDYIYTQHHKP